MSMAIGNILAQLERVRQQRTLRQRDAALGRRVAALKTYQQRRFALTHADLLADRRYGAAARFFLEDLYGPQDFAERDAQFARVVPALVRLFPAEIVDTVLALATLHALSEELDTAMAAPWSDERMDRQRYVQAWQATGQPEARREQLRLVLEVGRQLDRYTRSRLLRHSLRMMRGPARAAGLSALQTFLERGFDTFADMGGAEDFLQRVGLREGALIEALFQPAALATGAAVTGGTGQLP